jgi:hypothetical protein
MAVKRSKKKSRAKKAPDAYEQAMFAEGAPLALDLLGLGDTIRSVVRGRGRKAAPKRRAKTARTKVKASRTKTKSAAAKTRRRKTGRRA